MSSFRFQTPDPARFLPGQFAMLDLPDVEGDRAYSMANLPNNDGVWEFIIKNQPGGDGSVSLFTDFKEGAILELDGPYGEAVLEKEAKRDIICVGGGAGISQLISILSGAAALSSLDEHSLTLFYGGRRPEDICAPILLKQAGLASRVACITAVSEGVSESDWSGARGLIHDVLGRYLDQHSAPEHCEYYFCGPTPMTDAVAALLNRHSVPAAQMHFDSFG